MSGAVRIPVVDCCCGVAMVDCRGNVANFFIGNGAECSDRLFGRHSDGVLGVLMVC